MTPEELRHEVVIHAEPERVWDLVTTPSGLCEWMGVDAQVELEPGGAISWTHENGAVMRGRVVEVQPARRLVLRYGWEGDLLGVPPESTTVELTLDRVAEGTSLVLWHRGLPDANRSDHDAGWAHFLGQLAAAATTPRSRPHP